jgi:uncharacterized OsmC-like protein
MNATVTIHADPDARIRTAQNAVIERMRADPEAARSTIVTTGEIGDGLACHVRQGKFSANLDFGPGMGGTGTGPSPGFHARAGICGCVAMGIKMLAAREGLALRKTHVTVETDFDDAALFGLSMSTAAPVETRVTISIETDEDDVRIRALVDRALEMDPWYLALRDGQKVLRSIATSN